jgi:hemerythrin-like domain-containing protein
VTTAVDGPVDMRMMFVAHHALRRDLRKMRQVLAAPPSDRAYRRRLVRHFGRWRAFLRHHHEAEDAGLWPALRQRAPEWAGLLDAMEADHAGLDVHLRAARDAMAHWARTGTEPDRGRAADSLAALDLALCDHLAREEADAIPVVCARLSPAEWHEVDRRHFRPRFAPLRLPFLGPWFLDGLDPELASAVAPGLPGPLRSLLIERRQPAYARKTAVLWAPLESGS